MNKIYKVCEFILGLPKTLVFNFYYFKFRDAFRLPVFISHRVYLSRLAGKVVLGNCKTGVVKIGFGDVGIFDKNRSRSIWRVNGVVYFRGAATIGHGSKIGVSGELYFGKNVSITAESTIVAHEKVTIGDGALISWDVLIMDTDFHYIFEQTKLDTPINRNESVQIGKRVWIGCRSMVLKGVRIEDGVVIGAGTVVSRDLSKGDSVYIGSPSKMIKDNIIWRQ